MRNPPIPDEVLKLVGNQKLHHWVAQFHLRRFSIDPCGRTSQIHRLETTTGRTGRVPVSQACAAKHYNRLEQAGDLPPLFMEAFFSYIESRAAPVMSKIVAGERINEEERGHMAVYLHAQHTRTPRGRAQMVFAMETAQTLSTVREIPHNAARAREVLKKRGGGEPTDAEVRTWIDEIVGQLESGKLKIRASKDHEVLGQMLYADGVIPVIYDSAWITLRDTASHSFVISDDPLVMHDPQNPDQPCGWRSPSVEITLPLDPTVCLLIRPEPTRTGWEEDVGSDIVDLINLRTYANAHRCIYGPTQGVLQNLRMYAKSHTAQVARFKSVPPRIHVSKRIEGERLPYAVDVTHAPREGDVRRRPGRAKRQTPGRGS